MRTIGVVFLSVGLGFVHSICVNLMWDGGIGGSSAEVSAARVLSFGSGFFLAWLWFVSLAREGK